MWKRYPYTKGINLVPVCVWKPASQFAFKDVFDPAVLSEMEAAVRKIVEPQANNEMLIGYFWTDIPIWSRTKNGGWIAFYKSLPESSAGGMKWREWKSGHPNADESDFLVEIAKQLYAKGHEFVRKYDQNHLILGDRYHEVDIPAAVVREALPYIDAISIQPTSREFNFDFFDRVYEQYGKPMYIADHVSSFPTKEHPITMGKAAESANAYSDYYERYVTAALSRPYMIGFNKCQYQDEPGPKLLKQGLLKVSEEPYSVVERVAAANVVALKHAYADTQPTKIESSPPKTEPASKKAADGSADVRINAPAANASFSAGDEIVIKATADLDELNGRRVSFYYLDEKWKPIGHDDTAPFEATWTSPPNGTWDVYVAVHGQDWKIVSKSRVKISVGD